MSRHHSQSIVQWLLARCTSTEEDAMQAVRQITGTEGLTMDELSQIFANINDTLRPYYMDVRRVLSVETNRYTWVVCSTIKDEIAQMATECTAEQIGYFKSIIGFISASPKYQASSLDVLVRVNDTSLDKKTCEGLIHRWSNEGWLVKSPSGKLTVGLRTLIELESYLREDGLFDECIVCEALITTASNACNRCNARVHAKCFLETAKERDTNNALRVACTACHLGTMGLA